MRATAAAAFIIAVVAAAAGEAGAVNQPKTWAGSSGGIWGIAGNWTPATLPDSDDSVIFSQSATIKSIDLGANRTVADVSISGVGNYTLSGQTLTINSANLSQTGSASHRIRSNVALGAKGIWSIAGGELEVTGSITALGGGAHGIQKQGAGTLRLAGATNSFNHLRLEGGTSYIDEGDFVLTSATSDLYAALWLVGGNLNVGHDAVVHGTPGGSFVVEDGGTASSLVIDGEDTEIHSFGQLLVGIGGTMPSSITVSHKASIHDINVLAVGFGPNPAASTMTVRDGSTVQNAASAVGVNVGATGAVTVRDANSKWTTDFLGMGGYAVGQTGGTGTVTVMDSGALAVASELRFFTSTSALIVDSATASIGGLTNDAGVGGSIRIRNNGSMAALALNGADPNAVYLFDGVISNQGSGGGVVKQGASEQVFTKQQTYTGGTRIEGGTLTLGTMNTLAPTGAITAAGGTLNLAGRVQQASTVTIQGGAISGSSGSILLPTTLALQSGSLAVPTITGGTVAKTTTGVATVDAPLTASAITVSAGTLVLNQGATAPVQVNAGALQLRGSLLGNLSSSASGAVTLGGDAIVAGSSTMLGALGLGDHSFVNASASAVSVGSMTVAGGRFISEAGLSTSGSVSGYGAIGAKFVTTAGSSFTASGGSLTLGDAGVLDGFDSYLSTTVVGANQVNFLSAGIATLGNLTTVAGGKLASLHGIQLPSGRSLNGHGTVQGKFINQGLVTGGSSNQVLVFHDSVSGAGSFAGNVQFEGSYSPGNSAASVSFENLALTSSTRVELELGGKEEGTQFDHLDVSGALTLGGNLRVSLVGGFTPTAGDTFDLIDWNSRSGVFSSIQLPALNGLLWDASQLYATGTLRVVAPLAADFDLDGDVDADDLTAWKVGFGVASATRAQGDADGDGDVDGRDFLTWQRQYGTTSIPAMPVATAIPEPSTSMLALVCVGACSLVCRRRSPVNSDRSNF